MPPATTVRERPCDTQGRRCCVAHVTQELRGVAGAVVAAAAAERLELAELARMLLAVEVRARDPLGVPRGWRLYNGRLTADPALERRLAEGRGLPVVSRRCPVAAVPPGARLAGLLLAAGAALDGRVVAEGTAVRAAHVGAAGLVVDEVAALEHWTTNQAAAHHVLVAGRLLPNWQDDPVCPATRGPAADVLVASSVLLSSDRQLLAPVDDTLVLADGDVDPADLTGATGVEDVWCAAVARLVAGPIADGRLVSVTRDLAAGGQPRLVGVTTLRAAAEEASAVLGVELEATPLPADPDGAGTVLQAAAAASTHVPRARRGPLDVVGAALRERRVIPPRA